MTGFRRFFRYSIVFFTIITALLLSASYIVRKYFEEEVTGVIISELNKALDARVDVRDINFSLLSSFPRASLNFRNVIIYSSSAFEKDAYYESDKLLVSRSISIRFDLIDLYYRKYDVKNIVLEDTHLWLLIDSHGNPNYKIWKTGADSSEVSLSVSLEKIIADNVFLRYNDPKIHVIGFLDEAEFAGQYIMGDLTAVTSCTGNIQSFETDGFSYRVKVPIRFTSNFLLSGKKVKFSNTALSSRDIDLALDCDIDNAGKLSYLLDIKEGNTSIKAIEWFLPDSIKSKVDPYSLNGSLRFSGKLRKNKKDEEISADAQLYSNNISFEDRNVRYTTLGLLNVKVPDLTKPDRYYVESEAFKISVNNDNWVQAQFTLDNRYKRIPELSWEADFSVYEDLISHFYKNESLKMHGKLTGNSQGKCLLAKDFNLKDIEKHTATIDVFNAAIEYDSLRLDNVNLKVSLKNNNMLIPHAHFNYGNTAGRVSANVFSIVPFLDKSVTAPLEVKLKLSLDQFSYESIQIIAGAINENSKNATQEDTQKLKLHVFGNASVDEFMYDSIRVKKGALGFDYKNNTLKLQQFTGVFPFGTVDAQCVFNTDKGLFEYNSSFKDLDISRLFYEFNSFDQTYLTNRNISGSLTGISSGSFIVPKAGEFHKESINITSAFTIDNGKLIEFAPLMEMSKYLKEDELSDISFDKISNVLTIKNDSLYVPRMDISSSLADFSISGKQSLDNEFDYTVQVLLNKVLSARRKKRVKTEEFGEIKDDGYGRTSLPLRIKGNPDDFKVGYDRVAMKATVAKRWQQQTEELKDVLKDEFSKKNREDKGSKNKVDAIPSDFEFDWGD